MSTPPVKFGQVYELKDFGVAVMKPLLRSLQVSHPNDGNTVITYTESGRESVLFVLTADQCQRFIGLLAQSPINTQQPAAQAAGQGA